MDFTLITLVAGEAWRKMYRVTPDGDWDRDMIATIDETGTVKVRWALMGLGLTGLK